MGCLHGLPDRLHDAPEIVANLVVEEAEDTKPMRRAAQFAVRPHPRPLRVRVTVATESLVV